MAEKFTKVIKDKCIACGACFAAAPDIFAPDDEGLSESILDDNNGITSVDEDLQEELEDAQFGCPTEAIEVQDTPFDDDKE